MHMLTPTPLSVGQRLRIRRRQRGLPRRVVANLVGRSEEWLRLIESGQRALNNIEVLIRLAEVLRIDDPAELIGWPTGKLSSEHVGEDFHSLRAVLLGYPALREQSDCAGTSCDHALARSKLGECRQIWDRSPQRYSQLAHALPAVVGAVRAAYWRQPDREISELLVAAYQMSRDVLAACGDHALAGTVADRAMCSAGHTRMPLLMAASAWHLAMELIHSQKPIEAHNFALTAAGRIGDAMPTTVEAVVLWGALHIVAAHAAAVAGDLRESIEL
ncbi:helix-turn-helix domain-containing protein, partial [Nocardia gipuzkoensis]